MLDEAERRIRHLAKYKRYHLAHAEKCKAYRVANKEKLSATNKAWYRRNSVKRGKIGKKWNTENPEKVLGYRLMSRYNITVAERDAIFAAHIDHCHAVVGLLLMVAYLVDSVVMAQHKRAKQRAWECRPAPGYCDIDTDWRPSNRPAGLRGRKNAQPD